MISDINNGGNIMIILEFSKEDINYADRIADLAEISTVIVAPKSFSSELNDMIQVGIRLAPCIIPAVSLILVEMLKQSKKIKIKITDTELETEGLSERDSVKLAEQYILKQQEQKAVEIFSKLLKQDMEKDISE